MDSASIYYLGVTLLLFLVFAAIVARTYSRKQKAKGEQPKYRMMDDDYPSDEKKGGRDVRRK
ncbi:cbb3-type cytochrome c oxidase subunit 3 [Geomonas sp. Red69]|uniref:Cbb3-type cytochrome c oxidase subunit 3 n=1 Tax=Geomonas diazotrophica TaxID=2843197 RepID=A0ABX8JD38_9BACT|nr:MULTISPECIES: cbb3-type cytochrome c oxidase subunit 3 [Geomonas]MBU5637776.1 cbb3-type cytochrome c oxidase subunit 3 [Geomonas diazotrophica]QWV96310.1 cbb3-type cytochrome c oxidase subunit 3 [Geomonas nitrogeniifigens]QXE85377.1 cbb3-type cytochrome c oxidase subunit 3 [Geomonas nitrogeniifigens]